VSKRVPIHVSIIECACTLHSLLYILQGAFKYVKDELPKEGDVEDWLAYLWSFKSDLWKLAKDVNDKKVTKEALSFHLFGVHEDGKPPCDDKPKTSLGQTIAFCLQQAEANEENKRRLEEKERKREERKKQEEERMRKEKEREAKALEVLAANQSRKAASIAVYSEMKDEYRKKVDVFEGEYDDHLKRKREHDKKEGAKYDAAVKAALKQMWASYVTEVAEVDIDKPQRGGAFIKQSESYISLLTKRDAPEFTRALMFCDTGFAYNTGMPSFSLSQMRFLEGKQFKPVSVII
jgi:hypothetical protein